MNSSKFFALPLDDVCTFEMIYDLFKMRIYLFFVTWSSRYWIWIVHHVSDLFICVYFLLLGFHGIDFEFVISLLTSTLTLFDNVDFRYCFVFFATLTWSLLLCSLTAAHLIACTGLFWFVEITVAFVRNGLDCIYITAYL